LPRRYQRPTPYSYSTEEVARIVSTAASLRLTYPVEDVLKGLELRTSVLYNHHWATSNVTSTDEVYPCDLADGGAAGARRVCDQTGGSSTVSDGVTVGLGVTLTPVERLAFDLSFTWLWNRAHPLAAGTVDTLAGTETIPDMSETHWRNTTWFIADITYEITDWLSASLGLSTWTAQLNPNGTRRNPFHTVDSQLYLSAGVTLDKLYTALGGRSGATATAQAGAEEAEL
jgi:hypothetical protein